MKKAIALLAVAAAAFGAFAAFDFSGAKTIPVLTSATTVNAGTTNTTAISAAGLKGNAALFVTANGNASRTALNISLYTTNFVDGGWAQFATTTVTATNAGVYRLSFPAEYITLPAQVRIGSIGAASAVSAFVLSY